MAGEVDPFSATVKLLYQKMTNRPFHPSFYGTLNDLSNQLGKAQPELKAGAKNVVDNYRSAITALVAAEKEKFRALQRQQRGQPWARDPLPWNKTEAYVTAKRSLYESALQGLALLIDPINPPVIDRPPAPSSPGFFEGFGSLWSNPSPSPFKVDIPKGPLPDYFVGTIPEVVVVATRIPWYQIGAGIVTGAIGLYEAFKPAPKPVATTPKGPSFRYKAPKTATQTQTRVEVERQLELPLEPAIEEVVVRTTRPTTKIGYFLDPIIEIGFDPIRIPKPALPKLPGPRVGSITELQRYLNPIADAISEGTVASLQRPTLSPSRSRRPEPGLAPDEAIPETRPGKPATKDCVCEDTRKTQRKRCYSGFYKEAARSESKRQWQEVNCLTGRKVRAHG
jgi:hypothetical protein